MEALGIVDGIDEDGDGAPCGFDILEAAAIDFFGLEGLREALGFGIVVGIAGPAHADGDIDRRGAGDTRSRHIAHHDRNDE